MYTTGPLLALCATACPAPCCKSQRSNPHLQSTPLIRNSTPKLWSVRAHLCAFALDLDLPQAVCPQRYKSGHFLNSSPQFPVLLGSSPSCIMLRDLRQENSKCWTSELWPPVPGSSLACLLHIPFCEAPRWETPNSVSGHSEMGNAGYPVSNLV